MRKGKDAWNWAKARIKNESYPGYCKKFVRSAFDVESRSASAKEAWANTKYKFTPDDINDTPAYVAAYFKTGRYDHVVITGPKDSQGRRMCISTDVQDSDRDGRREVGLVPLQSLTKWGPFMGYGLDIDSRLIAAKPKAIVTGTVEPDPDRKTVREIAQEVIRGEWGDGVERKKRLHEAGYAYTAVQQQVNALLKNR